MGCQISSYRGSWVIRLLIVNFSMLVETLVDCQASNWCDVRPISLLNRVLSLFVRTVAPCQFSKQREVLCIRLAKLHLLPLVAMAPTSESATIGETTYAVYVLPAAVYLVPLTVLRSFQADIEASRHEDRNRLPQRPYPHRLPGVQWEYYS